MRTVPKSSNAKETLLSNFPLPEIAKTTAKLSTTVGFISRYFDYLPHYATTLEAFTAVNVEYYLIHGVFKFSSYQNFKKTF